MYLRGGVIKKDAHRSFFGGLGDFYYLCVVDGRGKILILFDYGTLELLVDIGGWIFGG